MYGSWICDLICDTRLDLWLPSQPQDIGAVLLVPNYTASLKTHMCEQLAKVVNLELNGRGGGEPANF